MVEQLTCNEQVPGSNPGLGSKTDYVDHILPNSWYTYDMAMCLQCGKGLERWQEKYCSNTCQQAYQYHSYIKRWRSESRHGNWKLITKNISQHLKRYLIEKCGEKCSLCGWDERHPVTKRVPLEVDHIDGDASNNNESNLRIICPNCHSLTVHFRNLNRTRGREWRIKYLQLKKLI